MIVRLGQRILMSVRSVSLAPKRNSQPVFWINICFAAESNGVWMAGQYDYDVQERQPGIDQ